ncbi:hypothetical protein AVEN_80467-1, partial [Araneus ventricosus]
DRIDRFVLHHHALDKLWKLKFLLTAEGKMLNLLKSRKTVKM